MHTLPRGSYLPTPAAPCGAPLSATACTVCLQRLLADTRRTTAQRRSARQALEQSACLVLAVACIASIRKGFERTTRGFECAGAHEAKRTIVARLRCERPSRSLS